MNKYLLIMISLISLCNPNCKQQAPKGWTHVYTMNDPRKNDTTMTFSDLRNKIVFNGDIKAYKNLRMAYWDNDYPEEILFYSIIMANLYDYDQACYDVYSSLKNIYIHTLQIDDVTVNLAMIYLFKAAEKGHDQAKKTVEKVLNSGIKGSREQFEFLHCK